MQKQYRALITCSQDPCTFCGKVARTVVAAHPDGPFDTSEDAIRHGQGIARNVYGASVHHVTIESRTITEWEKVK